jgi:glycine/D-amino acid oxidase-like deaminating enzyme
VNQDHVAALTQTAENLPELTEWLQPEELPWDDSPPDILGGLRLHSGCKVVHMPSYLEGLWEAVRSTGTGSKDWVILEESSSSSSPAWSSRLSEFDAVVLSAGSGLFHDSIVDQKLPISLIRGQSIEMTLNTATCNHAMLCGKYVSPLLEKNRILIGATHEFKETPLDPDQVGAELRERSSAFASHLWEDGTVDRMTSGYRVQSNRGQLGRIPIVGKTTVDFHDEAWIYTGLSSRGLLHHGIFGEILASKIINVESEHDHPSLDWWIGK